MSTDDQGTKRHRNIAENFNPLSRAHERYRRQTDGRAIAYSEREREFTFAKNSFRHLETDRRYEFNPWIDLLVSKIDSRNITPFSPVYPTYYLTTSQNYVRRCRLLLPTEWCGLSVCQSVCHIVSPAKRLKRSRCRLLWGLRWAQGNTCCI